MKDTPRSVPDNAMNTCLHDHLINLLVAKKNLWRAELQGAAECGKESSRLYVGSRAEVDELDVEMVINNDILILAEKEEKARRISTEHTKAVK